MTSESNMSKLRELKGLSADTPARKRLSFLFDGGEFTEINAFTKAGETPTGVITAYGYVEGSPVYAFSQDKTINSGAVTKAHSAKICKVMELAAKTGVPVVGIHDSNGAVVGGGADSLVAYSDMLTGTSNLSGVVPQIAVVAGTCAGSASMIACSADVVIMTKEAELFMAPPFNSDINNAGTAEMAAISGTASLVCDDDKSAMETARKIISMLPANNLAVIPAFEYSEPASAKGDDAASQAASVADEGSIVELSADFGTAAYTALATVQGTGVGIVATNKADSKLTADDASKIARFVRLCDSFNIPVITLIDTEGFDVSAENELTGAIRDMTKLAHAYAEATTIKLSVVTGKAYGPAFVAMCGNNSNADMTFAWPDAVITPLAPETAAEFLYHDKLKGAENLSAARKAIADEYANGEASAFAAAEKGCIDDIIAPEATRAAVISALDVMAGKRVSRLPKKHSNMPF